jgi:hypothetical protein
VKARPSLDVVERLVIKHRGDCAQPCDACDLAAEVIALLRLMRFVTEPEPAEPEKR